MVDENSARDKRYDLTWTLSGVDLEPSITCLREVGPGNVPDTGIGQVLAGFSAGTTSEWFGVSRYEYLLSARIGVDDTSVMVPGQQRRGYPQALRDRQAQFIGQVDDVLTLTVRALD